ncbi:MAG: PhoH family protein [Traorella sp.]
MNRFNLDVSYWSFDERRLLCGTNDQFIKMIEKEFDCQLFFDDQNLICLGENELPLQVIKNCYSLLTKTLELSMSDIQYLCNMTKKNPSMKKIDFSNEPIAKTIHGKLIYPKTIGQRILIQNMEKNDIVFASGVAGTGKTYLAVVYAISQLKKGMFSRIILTRPAVEAGESLGFLPGDLKEKVDPYLRPLYDALYDMLGNEQVAKLMEKDVIEIAPLAYMRGRTLDNAFIILDEAQNTTKSQMKMFLTRMGFNSKIVITGDTSQIDLVKKKDSGLMQAMNYLKEIDGIGICELTHLDVVRHPLVQKIIECYEKYENE